MITHQTRLLLYLQARNPFLLTQPTGHQTICPTGATTGTAPACPDLVKPSESGGGVGAAHLAELGDAGLV